MVCLSSLQPRQQAGTEVGIIWIVQLGHCLSRSRHSNHLMMDLMLESVRSSVLPEACRRLNLLLMHFLSSFPPRRLRQRFWVWWVWSGGPLSQCGLTSTGNWVCIFQRWWKTFTSRPNVPSPTAHTPLSPLRFICEHLQAAVRFPFRGTHHRSLVFEVDFTDLSMSCCLFYFSHWSIFYFPGLSTRLGRPLFNHYTTDIQ